jgi:hypothetical protein
MTSDLLFFQKIPNVILCFSIRKSFFQNSNSNDPGHLKESHTTSNRAKDLFPSFRPFFLKWLLTGMELTHTGRRRL